VTTVGHGVEPLAVHSGSPLRLLRQAKLASLLAPVAPDLDRLEASGVVLQDGMLWVIFDNLPHIAAIDPALVPGPAAALVVRQRGPAAGYEDIALDEVTGRRFVLIEAARTPRGGFKPQIDEYDAGWRLVHRRWVELDIEQQNKGLEGLTCVHRGGRRYLLALSEGNGNHGGRLGRRPGRGLVHVLAEQGKAWAVQERIHLPEDLPFVDYSGISVRGDRIAVVSQESSSLWVGLLDSRSWRVVDGGNVYPFPRDRRGRRLYGTVEGVSWMDERTVAVVSDRAKRSQARRLRATAESVHVFTVPWAEGSGGAAAAARATG
jgi:hypothetical protein